MDTSTFAISPVRQAYSAIRAWMSACSRKCWARRRRRPLAPQALHVRAKFLEFRLLDGVEQLQNLIVGLAHDLVELSMNGLMHHLAPLPQPQQLLGAHTRL